MDARGNPPPPEEPAPQAAPPPPPPPGGPAADGDEASGGWRVLSVILCIALAFACVVMVTAAAEVSSNPACDDVASDPPELEKFLSGELECVGELTTTPSGQVVDHSGSAATKTAQAIFFWPSAVLAGLAALIALFFAVTGRQGRLLMQLTGAAIVLGAVAILIGQLA